MQRVAVVEGPAAVRTHDDRCLEPLGEGRVAEVELLDPVRCGTACRPSTSKWATRPPTPAFAAASASRSISSTEVWLTPGMDPTARRSFLPSRTKTGSTSCAGAK